MFLTDAVWLDVPMRWKQIVELGAQTEHVCFGYDKKINCAAQLLKLAEFGIFT